MFGDILWTIFAWVFGILFFFGGIYNLFAPFYSDNNVLISVFSIGIGFYLIYKWFKERQKVKSK